MSLRRASAELTKVRGWRNRRDPDWTIARAVSDAHAAVERTARSGTALERAWREVCPAELAARAWPVSCSRGLLTIRAGDASTRWEVDRWLRSGGETALARAARVGVRRVKFVSE
ncbi:MAG: DciA family protein [Phycisphaerales bacterium]